jgi:tight adherence protein C
MSHDRCWTELRWSNMEQTYGAVMIIIFGLVGLFFLWKRAKQRMTAKQDRAIIEAFPDCIDLFIAALRAGYSPAQGINFLGQHAPGILRPNFIAASRRIDEGERFIDAIRLLQSEIGAVSQSMCDVLISGDRLGIPVENLLFQLGNEARLNRRRRAETEARQLPIRLSLPLVMCILPSFVILIIVPTIAGTLSQLHISV